MSDKTTCKLCSSIILAATADRTNGMCMPCSKDPERVQRAEDYLKELKQAKVINRTLADQPSEDPYSILWRFQSRVNIDGLDQTDEEELVEVLHCLNLCNATGSAKVINDLLDFIEMSCSPEGYFDPSLVQNLLYHQASSELKTFERRLREAFELETPVDKAETLYGEPEE